MTNELPSSTEVFTNHTRRPRDVSFSPSDARDWLASDRTSWSSTHVRSGRSPPNPARQHREPKNLIAAMKHDAYLGIASLESLTALGGQRGQRGSGDRPSQHL